MGLYEELTLEQKSRLSYQKTEGAALAASLLQKKEKYLVPGALEYLVGKDGLNLSPEAVGVIAGATANEESINTTLEVYLKAYNETKNNTPVSELLNWYSSVLQGTSSDAKKVQDAILKYGNKTYGAIRKEIENAQWKLDDPNNNISDAEKAKAKETLEGYKHYIDAMTFLESYRLEEMRPKAVEISKRRNLEKLAQRL
jgi:hypothetical protein